MQEVYVVNHEASLPRGIIKRITLISANSLKEAEAVFYILRSQNPERHGELINITIQPIYNSVFILGDVEETGS